MSETHDEIRALRVMVEELRAETPPELPWDAIEQRLLTRIDRLDRLDHQARADRPRLLRPVPSVSALPRVLGFVAAAAAIALGISSVGGQAEMPRAAVPEAHAVEAARTALAPGEAGAAGAHDLGALAAGDVIEAGAAPVTFARDGLCSWTLAPGSAVRVRSMGDSEHGVGHTVALLRGSIRAEVVPRDPSEGLVEAFAVEVSSTRIAVHGTAFSVSLGDGRADVDVEHGTVAVGPVGYAGATTGHILVGPARATFSLDGGRSARLLARKAPEAPAVAARVEAEAPAPAEPVQVSGALAIADAVAPGALAAPAAPVVVAARPGQPAHGAPRSATEAADVAPAAAPPELPALTEAGVRTHLGRCFRSTHAPASASVEVSVSATLRVRLNADGSVLSARMDPPLKPEFQTCAVGGLTGRFAPGTGHVDIPFSFSFNP